MLALILSAALGQWSPQPPGMLQYDPGAQCQRTGGRCFLNRSGNRPRENYAFFEFAPASGAGMGTACACTTPTGAKGEAMTFTRAGDATCARQGLATTGILNGDLVVCTANQPRVESSGGVLGLRVEAARTNSALRSQELDNAAWVDDSNPVSNITVTANQATAPDGTLTAERFQIPARTAAQWSLRRQAIAAGSTGSASVYLKGNGTSGSVSLIADGALATCVDCAFNSSTWSRCTLSAAGAWIFIGSASGYGACAGGSRAAEDVFVWGAQTEGSGVATYATSYIPTVAAAVTRNAEAASFLSISTSPRCVAGSFQVPYTIADGNRRIANPTNAAGTLQMDLFVGTASGAVNGFAFDGVQFAQATTANLISVGPTVNRAYTYFNPNVATFVALNSGVEATAAGLLVDPVTTDRIGIGCYAPTPVATELNGVVSQVQVDPSTTRCR